jgi:hypothetical protein
VPRGFLFLVPDRCPKCEKPGAVTLEQTLKGNVIAVMWCCKLCGEEWPVTPSDHTERRRGGVEDRRKGTRTDRRKT